jgi:hypothetical protein
MMLVYIAHRLGRGPDREENLREAERWVEWAASHGVVPIAPWVTLARFWAEDRRSECMHINGEALRYCRQYWMCGAIESPGMLDQRDLAVLYGLSIRRFVDRSERP